MVTGRKPNHASPQTVTLTATSLRDTCVAPADWPSYSDLCRHGGDEDTRWRSLDAVASAQGGVC